MILLVAYVLHRDTNCLYGGCIMLVSLTCYPTKYVVLFLYAMHVSLFTSGILAQITNKDEKTNGLYARA